MCSKSPKRRRPRPDPHQVPAIRGWDGSHYAGIYGNSQKIEKLFIMTYHYVGKTLLVYLFEGRYDPYISILIKEHVCPRSCCLKANLHETQSMIPIFFKKNGCSANGPLNQPPTNIRIHSTCDLGVQSYHVVNSLSTTGNSETAQGQANLPMLPPDNCQKGPVCGTGVTFAPTPGSHSPLPQGHVRPYPN